MPTEQTCPTCGVRLTVRDDSPAVITCPRCLTQQANAAWTPGPGVVPRRVIPVEQQLGDDTTGINAGLVIMVVIFAIAALAILFNLIAGRGQPAGIAVVVVFALVSGAVVWLIRSQPAGFAQPAGPARPPPLPPPEIGQGQPLAPGEGPPLLEYRGPTRGIPTQPFSFGRLVLGFFLAIGLSIVAFVVMAMTVDSKGPVKPVVVLCTVAAFGALGYFGATSRRRHAVRGFGRGIMIGMILGLIALTPCAGCYLLVT